MDEIVILTGEGNGGKSDYFERLFIDSFQFDHHDIIELQKICKGIPGIYVFYGTGNNGKSTFLNKVFLPCMNAVHVNISNLSDPYFAGRIQKAELLYMEVGDEQKILSNKIELKCPLIIMTNNLNNPDYKKIVTCFRQNTPYQIITFRKTFGKDEPDHGVSQFAKKYQEYLLKVDTFILQLEERMAELDKKQINKGCFRNLDEPFPADLPKMESVWVDEWLCDE